MENTQTTTAEHLPASLEAKINAYQDKLLERFLRACNHYRITSRTQTAVADDMAAFLHYKDAPIRLEAKGFNEMRRQDFLDDAIASTGEIPLAILFQSYEDINHANEIINALLQSASPTEGKQLAADLRDHFAASTPIAQTEIARHIDIVDEEAREIIERQMLRLFYICAIYFSGATAEELVAVEPREAALTEKDREAVIKDAMRAATDFDKSKRASTPSSDTEIVEAEEIADNASRQGVPTEKGGAAEEPAQPVEEAVYIDEEAKKQQYYFFRQSYTKLLSRPLPVSFSTQGRKTIEPIRIRDLKEMPVLFKEQADRYEISETRIYQVLDALQIITQEKGEKHHINGYDYYFYDLTLNNLIRIGTGSNERPNGRTYGEYWTALWILSNIRILVDEEVIKGYITDKKTNKQKPITQPRESFIQMLNVPIITTPKKPQDKSTEAMLLTLQVHCFVKDGRTQEYITEGGNKFRLKLPRYDKIPKEEEDLARKLFNRKDTGIRFYNILKFCYHKEEEDLLAQVFDYQRKQSKAQSEEEFNRVTDSIARHKWQDLQSLKRMFERAKQNGILEYYERKQSRQNALSAKPTYVWQWKRTSATDNATEEEGAEE